MPPQLLRYDSVIRIGARQVSLLDASYFIADIASNHDGDLGRAKALIFQAKEAGADAVKFQHFKAERIVSDRGFRTLGGRFGHQASWGKPVVDVYRACEVNRSWNDELAQAASSAGIDFMTTPYDYEAVETVDALVPAFKIGSGDITWTDFIAYVAARGKPVLLATGASSIEDVERAVASALAQNPRFALLQCNTNYTGALENFRHVNLRVLKTYALRYPGMILGLSDHTPGHATVLGAIALGARIIEKHFTDDNGRSGPDHAFSMNPSSWREMLDRARELEAAQGDGIKRVEENERETVVLQRRCLRLIRDMPAGAKLAADDVEPLRPAPAGALAPYQLDAAVGRRLLVAKQRGDELYSIDLTD
jgi:sialic acid synthase SpsE